MKNPTSLTFTLLLLAVSSLSAATHYVSLGSANPTPPYINWMTAATNIQDAVDAVAPGDIVVVTNGMYAARQTVDNNGYFSRVAVTNAISLRSVNGPQFTIIDGGAAVRCCSLNDGASLTGFTLTHGYTYGGYGGGVYCTSANAFLTNCVIVGNWAWSGGGVSGGTMYNCTLSGNSVDTDINHWDGVGGGALGGMLYNCTLSGNSAKNGGGADQSTLYNCTLTGNSASQSYGESYGGGACECTLYNCTLSGNSATSGGGADQSTLYNCTLTGNSAPNDEYGDSGSGGGASMSTLYNCIVYFNTASGGANYDSCGLYYCCATPLPTNGLSNIGLDPQLASASHLSASSPCRGAGSAAYATGADVDGEAWANPPSIGCDEYHAGAVTGPLTVSLLATYTNVAAGYAVAFTALIEGRTTCSVWDFGDGIVVSNRPCVSHPWAMPGDYSVVLRAYNESLPGGVSAALTVHVVQEVHYVASTNPKPQQPYTSWATAATDIKDAVNEATAPGLLVLVSNGVYAGGFRVNLPLMLRSVNGPQSTVIDGGDGSPCVSLTDGASLTGFTLTHGGYGGVSGPSTTNAFLTNCVITGNSGGADSVTLYNCTMSGNSLSGARQSKLYNCTVSGNSAHGAGYGCTLNNCTLTGNSVSGGDGGGAFWSTLYNCTLTGNSARSDQLGTGGHGGGASDSTLYNCSLSGNSVSGGDGGGASYSALYNCTLSGNLVSGGDGGGACYSTLYNCTLTGNSALYGGGVYGGTLNNCIVYYNTASHSGANYESLGSSSILNYCCTTPMPTNGLGNITNVPLFVDYTNDNLRLQSNSPCINAGNDAHATTSTDLDGRPRIVGGTVDMGAYEFQPGFSGAFIGWLQQYGLPTDGSADYADSDNDGLNNWQEWVCGTNPTNAQSALRMMSALPTGTTTTVRWQSVAGVNYFLERSTNLASPFTLLATNIVGQAGTTSFADTNVTGTGPVFYRVGVPSW